MDILGYSLHQVAMAMWLPAFNFCLFMLPTNSLNSCYMSGFTIVYLIHGCNQTLPQMRRSDLEYGFMVVMSILALRKKKPTIHEIITMLATSKNVLVAGHNHLLTTCTDDLELGHFSKWQAWWLPGGLWLFCAVLHDVHYVYPPHVIFSHCSIREGMKKHLNGRTSFG